MKKVIALVLSLVLVLSMSVTAFADNLTEYSASGSATVSLKIYSSCYVTIPETIDVNTGNSWNIEIVSINVLDNEAIKVSVTNLPNTGEIELSNPNTTKTINFALNDGDGNRLDTNNTTLALFTPEDLTVEVATKSFSGEVTTNLQDMKAGTYSGTMQYSVSIEEYSGN